MSDGDDAGGTGVGERVAAAVEELYGADPQVFTERRTELAAAARSAGDREGAKAIGALRRPTRAAWVINHLARSDPSAPAKLAELATALRAAQQAGHGPRLRELSAARGALVDALTSQALSVAGVADPPPSLRAEIVDTLTAAVADPAVAAAFASGTLTRAMQWSGFGVLPETAGAGGPGGAGRAGWEGRAGEEGAWPAAWGGAATGDDRTGRERGGIDGGPAIPRPRLGVVTGGRAAGAGEGETGTDDAPAGSRGARRDASQDSGHEAGTGQRAARQAGGKAAVDGTVPTAADNAAGTAADLRTADGSAGGTGAADLRVAGKSAAGSSAAGTARGGRAGRTGAAKASTEAAARRQAEAEERLAREAAERAARRREQYAEAERLAASTAATAADALGCEDRLETEVRDLEERLTRTRAELAAVRMKARHAESAERRARQALDRLPRE